MRFILSIIRLTVFVCWSFFSILVCFLFSFLLFSKKPTVFFARFMWAPFALMIMGVRIKIKGRENVVPGVSYVVMANHSSYLDIPSLMRAMPINLHFIAKKEFKPIPFLGWYLMLADTILIDRKNSIKAKESLAVAAKLVHDGRHVALFPEGTRTKTGEIGPFKKGGFHLAKDADVAIIPVHIHGSYFVWSRNSMFKIKAGPIQVTIGKPITPEEYNKMDLNRRVEFVRDTITKL